MKIKMKTIMAGPNLTAGRGQIVDVPDEVAMPLLNGGFAEAVKVPKMETATMPPVEAAVIPEPEVPVKKKRGRK